MAMFRWDGAVIEGGLASQEAGPAERAVALRLWKAHGAARIMEVLRAVALDTLCPVLPDDLPAVAQSDLYGLVRDPVDAAAVAALEALISRLGPAFASAPGTLLAEVDRLRVRSELGCD